ncbi:uncharacterized protein LOC112576534 [Pomacea canaliculata]|uniref:uncharacterized protein LOC112576534 n=1 Tax=Pomacea canaliculata TaxID=400727 RepID=UPI000D729271|nr:uncharacterized protein LOC112576534 [Pomacea canaliculata]
MDVQTKCVVSQVFFLDVGDLDAAEIQRICNILGVPEPELQASPMARGETLPAHPPPELDKEPESNCKIWASEAEGEPSMGPSVLTADASCSDVENVNQSPHSEAPQQFGDVVSNTGHNIYMAEHNLTIPPPMQTLVPLGMHPVVVTNALGVSGVTNVCMVSVPAGIPALPGIPVHGLPPFLPHPATFHGDPADLNFFQNHPPPNMSRMNPHVQEFVPGRDYIMRDDSCQSMPALHPHQQMPPQHLPPPVAFVTPSYAKLSTTHVTGASHPIQGFPSDGHPSGGQLFMVESDSVPPPGVADVFDPSNVGEPLVANDFQEVQGLFPHVANSTVFSHHPVPNALHLQEQSLCRNMPVDVLHMPASGVNAVPDIILGDFGAASSHCPSATIPDLAAGDNLLNSIPVKQHTRQLLSAATSMPNDALSNSAVAATLENSSDPQVQPFDSGLGNNSWGRPFVGSNVVNISEKPLEALPKDGQESVMSEDGIVQSDNAADSSADHTKRELTG